MPLDLQGKVGPLPAWAWGGLIGVAVVAFAYMHSSNKAVTTAVPQASVDGVDGMFGTANGGTAPVMPDDPTQDPADFSGLLPDYSGVDFTDRTSLETWIARAVLWLSGQGTSPVAAQTAISNYLQGIPDPAGQSIVQQAILHFGPPPLGVDPGTVDQSPTPAAPVTPPPAAPAPAPTNLPPISYQGSVNDTTTKTALPPQDTPYTHGQLMYTTDKGQTIQTADTPANRAYIASRGWSIVGGY